LILKKKFDKKWICKSHNEPIQKSKWRQNLKWQTSEPSKKSKWWQNITWWIFKKSYNIVKSALLVMLLEYK
jgi:hypothetical protein